MAEFCLDCYKRICRPETTTEEVVVLSVAEDICEGYGAVKAVVVSAVEPRQMDGQEGVVGSKGTRGNRWEARLKNLLNVAALLAGLHAPLLPVMASDIQESASRDTPIPSAHRRVIKMTPPEYPSDLDVKERAGKLEVVLRIFISPGGQVEKAEVERTSGSMELDEMTIGAVGRWKYEATGAAETSLVKIAYSATLPLQSGRIDMAKTISIAELDTGAMASVGKIFERISRRSAGDRIDMDVRLMRRTPAERGVHWIAEAGGRELPTVATYQILISELGEVTDVERVNSSRVWLDDVADSILKETKYQPFSEPTRQYMAIKTDSDSPPNVFVSELTGAGLNFDGVWQSNMGLLYLKQVGNDISGKFDLMDARLPSRILKLSIKGVADGERCTFKYSGGGLGSNVDGEGRFQLSKDGHILRGDHKAEQSKKWEKWEATRATTWEDVAVELAKYKNIRPPKEKKAEQKSGVRYKEYWLPDADEVLDAPVELSDTLAEFVRDMEKLYTLLLEGVYDDRPKYIPMWDHWVRVRKLAKDIRSSRAELIRPNLYLNIHPPSIHEQVDFLNERLNEQKLHIEVSPGRFGADGVDAENRRDNSLYLDVWLGEPSLKREVSIDGKRKSFVAMRRMPLVGVEGKKFREKYKSHKFDPVRGYASTAGNKFVVNEDLQRKSAYIYAFLACGLEQEGVDVSQYKTWSELRRGSDFVQKHFKTGVSDFQGGCWIQGVRQCWNWSGGLTAYFGPERVTVLTNRLASLMVKSTAIHEITHLADTARRRQDEKEAMAYCVQLYGSPIIYDTLNGMESNVRTLDVSHGKGSQWIFEEILKMMNDPGRKPAPYSTSGVEFDKKRSTDRYLPILGLRDAEIRTYAYRLIQTFPKHERILKAMFKQDGGDTHEG